ncbi:MAG TPA: hypothetical protein VLZ05_16225 [Mycobacterium sp.]|nr:hypothetical protein [Mycobacterium sp.]HUH70261.1 hypothetical protein [Mycobacterium sp.]
MDHDRYLLHQVHAAKLATDITCGIVSTALMWRHRVVPALVIAFAPAIVASALVLRLDLSGLRDTQRGRYVLANMPPTAQVVRMLGQIFAWLAAYQRRPSGIVVGILITLSGWSLGLVRR